jgi:chain length determinant protein EpsF
MSFQQLLEVLRGRFKAIALIISIVLASTLVVSLLLPKQYTASTTLVVDMKRVDPVTGQEINALLLPSYMATQADIIRSRSVALKVVDGLKLAEDPNVRSQYDKMAKGTKGNIRDWLADLILKEVIIRPSRDSNAVQIEYTGVDPRAVAALVNKYAESYVATNLELKTDPAKHYANWYGNKIKDLRDNLEKVQANLSEFQQKTGFVALDDHLDVEISKLSVLARQLTDTQLRSLDAQVHRNQFATAGQNVSETTSPDVLANTLVQSLRLRLVAAEAKLAEVAEKYYPHHPKYRQAYAEAKILRETSAAEIMKLMKSATTAAEVAHAREKKFEQAFANQKAKILELNKWKDKMAVLTREVDHAQEAYLSGLKQLSQSQMESQVNQTNVAILDPAVPPSWHSKPNLKLNMVVAGLLGTLLGGTAAFLLELFDRRIRSIDDLTPWLDAPVVGVLADNNSEMWLGFKPNELPKEKSEYAQTVAG